MIRRWAIHRAAFWEREYASHAGAAHLLNGTPIASHAEKYKARAERRRRRWENLLVLTGTRS